MEVRIDPSWKSRLAGEFEEPYFRELTEFVKKEYENETVYPPPKFIFRAFDLSPFEQTNVVILGQDPYINPAQANGLCFAVGEGVALPPSLTNIYKEIASEYGTPYLELARKGGDLSRWAKQGVLLLNATLTVRASQSNSHAGRGWERFTDAAVKALSDAREHVVFMLWGNYAKKKGMHIDRSKHLVLESAHPSPLSASAGFFGNGHFKRANEYLEEHGEPSVEWLL